MAWSYQPQAQPKMENQASVFMSPGGRVAQLYHRELRAHFSRLLRHAWATVVLFSFPGHHTGAPS
jgi:hypothetical protein